MTSGWQFWIKVRALAAELASVKAERDSEIARVHDERSEKYQLELRILDLLAERDRLREAVEQAIAYVDSDSSDGAETIAMWRAALKDSP